jgi:hypothetical protein
MSSPPVSLASVSFSSLRRGATHVPLGQRSEECARRIGCPMSCHQRRQPPTPEQGEQGRAQCDRERREGSIDEVAPIREQGQRLVLQRPNGGDQSR